MSGMGGLFASMAAGAAVGYGTNVVEQAKAKREAALRQLEMDTEMKFRTSEREADQKYRSGEAEKARQSDIENSQGDLIDMGDGRYGVRRGTTIEPLMDSTTNQPANVPAPKAGYRFLTPEEKQEMGLDPAKAFQVDEGGENAGKVSPVGGAETTINLDSGKLTEGQSKDVNFFTRGIYANDDLAQVEKELTSAGGNVAGRMGVVGNYFKDPQYRQAERAGREVLAVILRKDTGAAVTQQEFELYGPMYLPWPGDDIQTIADKREARIRAIDSMEIGLGTARPLAKQIRDEFNAKRGYTTPEMDANSTMPNNAPRPRSTIIDGYTIEEVN
jgi:hypothetical protein